MSTSFLTMVGGVERGSTSLSLKTNSFVLQDPSDITKTLIFSASGSTSGKTLTLAAAVTSNRTLTLPDITDTLVARTSTDTLTNKTLSGNTATNLINGAGTFNFNSTGTLTAPNATDTLVGRSTSDVDANRLQNKHLDDTSVKFVATSDTTKRLVFGVGNLSTGVTLTMSLNLTTSQTLQVPNITATDTFAVLGLAQTLTNKTLNNTNTINVKDTLFTLQDDGDSTKTVNFQLSGISTASNRVWIFPDVTDTFVGTTAAQTLTNKTLDGATLSGVTNLTGTTTIAGSPTFSVAALFASGTAAAPSIAWSADSDGSGTGIFRAGANTIAFSINGTEAMRVDSSGNTVPGADNTYSLGTSSLRWKDLHVIGASIKMYNGANALSLTAAPSTARTLTLPDATDTLVGKATIDTLTNKTISTGGTNLIGATTISGATGTTNVVFSGSPTIATPTITTSATVPLVIGGTTTTSTLTLRSTSGSGTTGADIIFQAGSNGATEIARFLNNGTVGIGASPSTQFVYISKDQNASTDIGMSNGTSGTAARIQIALGNNISGGAAIIATYSSAYTTSGYREANALSVAARNDNSSLNLVAEGASGIIKLWTTTSGGSTLERIRIDATGNVGIGTTSPGRNLDIKGNSTVSDSFINLNRFDNGGTSGLITQTGGTNDWIIGERNGASDFNIFSFGTSSNVVTVARSDGRVAMVSGLTTGTSSAIAGGGTTMLYVRTATDKNFIVRAGSDFGSFTGIALQARTDAGADRNFLISADSLLVIVNGATAAFTVDSSGNGILSTVGAGLRVKEGTNAKMGTSTLSGGTVTVSTTAVTASSRIFLTSQVDGGTPGFVRVSSRTAGTSFVITSSNGADTSTIAWMLVEPA